MPTIILTQFYTSFKKQRGQPLSKRIRKGAWKRKELHCSSCKGISYNIQKCRHAPAQNRRQQRARDREESTLDSDSNSNSNLSSDSNNSNDSDDSNYISTSSLDIECDDARMHKAEIKLHNKRIARAYKIIERRKREQALKDNNRDKNRDRDESELLVLASSQFDSIEGIESSQGIISEGIASKGIASKGIASKGVTGRDIQGAITQATTSSPRRTQSSKVLKGIKP